MPSRATAYTACVAMKADAELERRPTSGGTIRRAGPGSRCGRPVAARTTRTGGSLVMGHLAYDRQ